MREFIDSKGSKMTLLTLFALPVFWAPFSNLPLTLLTFEQWESKTKIDNIRKFNKIINISPVGTPKRPKVWTFHVETTKQNHEQNISQKKEKGRGGFGWGMGGVHSQHLLDLDAEKSGAMTERQRKEERERERDKKKDNKNKRAERDGKREREI